MAHISHETGIRKSVLFGRIGRGYSMQEAIEAGQGKGNSANTTFHEYKGERISLRALCLKYGIDYPRLKRQVNEYGKSLEESILIVSQMKPLIK